MGVTKGTSNMQNGKGSRRRRALVSEEQLNENWSTTFNKVRCCMCGELVLKSIAHRHRDRWVGDECCWDDRLKVTE